MIASILQDFDLIVALLPLEDLEGSSGKNRNGRGGRSGPYTNNAPDKGQNGKSKGYWGAKGLTVGTIKARTAQKARTNQKRATVLEGQIGVVARRPPLSGSKTCYGFNLGTCTDANYQKADHSCIIFEGLKGAFFEEFSKGAPSPS